MKNKYEMRGDVTVIFLNRKEGPALETIIDSEDFEKVNNFPNTWVAQYNISTKKFYVKGYYGSRKDRKVIHLHRLITDCPDDLEPDHGDRDPLNNRRTNLHNVTRKENLQNRRLKSPRGVYHDKINGRWIAYTNVNGNHVYLGSFNNEVSALECFQEYKENGINAFDIQHRKERKKNSGSVSWKKNDNKWQVRVTFNGKQKHIGTFTNKLDAEKALNDVLNVV